MKTTLKVKKPFLDFALILFNRRLLFKANPLFLHREKIIERFTLFLSLE